MNLRTTMPAPRASDLTRLALLTATLLLAACGTSEAPAQPTLPAVTEAPAPVPPIAAPPVIGFHGFGPARFGQDEEAIRMSWGRPLVSAGAEPDACRQLFLDPRPEGGFGISFMLVANQFARYDVDSPRYVAPGDAVVGMAYDEVMKRYAGRIEPMPHKYVEGAKLMIVTPAEGGDARLVFETTADGRVSRWRIGLLPAVLYAEGCS